MYDKAIKDMEANTGIYDFVYIEQDIIYSYLSRNFLVDITKTLKDKPELEGADFKVANFTAFADYFKDANGDIFGVPMEAFVKVYLYRKDLFDDPKIQEAFKSEIRQRPGAGDHPRGVHARSPSSSRKWGKDNGMELWGTTVQAHTGHPASWYEFFESWRRPSASTIGASTPRTTMRASVANGGSMNGPKAKAALEVLARTSRIAPPESTQSTWDEVAATFAAGRAAQGLSMARTPPGSRPMPTRVKVVGNVGIALPPLEPTAYGRRGSRKGLYRLLRWRRLRHPGSSKNKEAALLFLRIHRPGFGAARLGDRRAAHHQHVDL